MNIYDLSQPVFQDSPEWPGQGPTNVRRVATVARDGVNKEVLTLSTHSGSHVDAPFHFIERGATVDQLPLAAFAGPAVVVDLRGKPEGACVERGDLEIHADRIDPGDIVLLNTGWGELREHPNRYLRAWPYVSAEAARWLVDAQVKGVGTDTVSAGTADDADATRVTHLTLLGAGIFVAEDLCIPDELMDGKKRWFSAFPILLRGCGAAWTRAVALDFEERPS